MVEKEFEQFKHTIDPEYPASDRFDIDSEHAFYIEPNFYSQLKYLESNFSEQYNLIIEELLSNVSRNKKVIFTADFEAPATYKDDFIYQEIEDITNKINIFVGYKSRGSDYGD